MAREKLTQRRFIILNQRKILTIFLEKKEVLLDLYRAIHIFLLFLKTCISIKERMEGKHGKYLADSSELMEIAAITAPKGGGKNFVVTKILTHEECIILGQEMIKYGEESEKSILIAMESISNFRGNFADRAKKCRISWSQLRCLWIYQMPEDQYRRSRW